MPVDIRISDLWFNHDHSSYTLHDKDGQFEGYDEAKMKEEADIFLDNIRKIADTCISTPSTDELIADFHKRC